MIDHPWNAAPAPGTTIEVAAGIRWVRMPLPFALDHINLWLLEDGDGWVVVDTGVGLAETRELWERIFATELGGRPVTRVVVTHFHPDHMGNAGWLTQRWGVEVWCTQAEYLFAHLAHRASTAEDFAPRLEHYRRNGCDEAALARLARRGNHYPGLVPSVPREHRRLRDGDVLTIGGRRWRALETIKARRQRGPGARGMSPKLTGFGHLIGMRPVSTAHRFTIVLRRSAAIKTVPT